ncbi:MAG: phosphatidylglycerophosphatase A [Candidatus Sumerlaeia bacterium]|nr:phosphatidylglycerophosphatase A [Candidatus Sumerlaeia bacterium]
MRQFSEYPPRRRLVLVFSSGLFTGYIPFASGTFATLLAIPLFYPLVPVNVFSFPKAACLAIVLAALSCAAVWLSGAAERTYGEKDSHKIVIDEIAGFFVAMVFVPFRWPQIVAAFLIFRALDVLKPAPIRQSQRLPGGWGIVTDDLLAGLYTCIMVHGLMSLGVL